MSGQVQLMRGTAVFVSIFSVIAMAVMLRFASVKTVVIAEDITAGAVMGQGDVSENLGKELLLSKHSAETGAIRIPIAKEVRPDDIVIENRYIDYVINIFITGSEKGFYAEQEISGNLDKVVDGVYYEEKELTRLQLNLNGFYEHQYLFENNTLYLEFVQPRDIYDKIVVIDAAHGGEDYGNRTRGISEKELALDIAMKLREKLEASDIKAYYTRVEDVNPTERERAALANQARADMFISIHANAAENKELYGTEARYNPDFVIPYFGNAELSDVMERQVVKKIDGRANGLFAAEEEEQALLHMLKVPSTVLEVGYLTNEQEVSLLKKSEYREQIAEGIYNAILSVYETEK